MPTTTVKTDKSTNAKSVDTLGLSVAGLAGFLYNFIITVIAVISFTNNDKIFVPTPNFGGGPCLSESSAFMLSNGAKNAAKTGRIYLSFKFLSGCMLTSFIIWGWDQLWGVPGFANDKCAYDNFGTYNSTDGADNDGHKLFTAVEYWMYFYMIIDAIFILGICCIGGFIVVGGYQEARKKNAVTSSSTTEYRSNVRV